MENSREIVLKLIRMALGWETDFSLPSDVCWKDVFDIASDQGVTAIILDGYEAYLSNNPQKTSPLSTPENKPLMLQAIGKLNMIEFGYLQHQESLMELSNILSKRDIPFIVMKGFACGQYYPIPKHRTCGDIDIYPGDKYNESIGAIKDIGIAVDSHYYRHSTCMIKDVMIENHRILCDLRGPRKQTKALEAQLEDEARKSILDEKNVVIDGVKIVGARYPSANFNALFLPWHVSAHFEFENVTLRHLLDWALFLVNDGHKIDVEMFREAKRKYTYGYSKISDILTNLSLRYLKMPDASIPLKIIEDAVNFDDSLADKVFDYMFVGQPRERDTNLWKFRWNNTKRIWQERWKYKEMYGMGAIRFLLHKLYGVIFQVGEDE